jgi:hypothetical protein
VPKSETKAVSDLVERLAGWVEQQPEYPLLFLADRPRRRRAARIVAYRLMVLPAVPATSPGRANIRSAVRGQTGRMGKFMGQLSKRRERLKHKAERDRARYRRLSMRRAVELAYREDAARPLPVTEEEA